MKVLVTGDRNYEHPAVVHLVLSGIASEWGTEEDPITVIQGVCPNGGADKFAENWSEVNLPEENRIGVAAQWDIYGKAAGPKRNQQMLEMNPDIVVGFHDNIQASKGTKHMLNIAKQAGIPTFLVTGW